MSANVNKVILIGNLTRDPELRYTTKGDAVATFSIAINKMYKDKNTGEMKKKVDYIPIVVWGKQAENADKYTKKGSSVYIEGTLNLKEWKNKDQETVKALQVTAFVINYLDSKPSTQSVAHEDVTDKESKTEDETDKPMTDPEDIEIPF